MVVYCLGRGACQCTGNAPPTTPNHHNPEDRGSLPGDDMALSDRSDCAFSRRVLQEKPNVDGMYGIECTCEYPHNWLGTVLPKQRRIVRIPKHPT